MRPKDMLNKILINSHTPKVIYWLLGALVGAVSVACVLDAHSIYDWSKIVLTPIVIFCSLVITAMQFAYNRQWNAKDEAHKSLALFYEKYNEIIEELHKEINIRDYIANRERLDIVYIHNSMGVFTKKEDSELYEFVYHGTENKEITPQTKDDNYTKTIKIKDGSRIERSIVRLLSEFEYMCSAVDNEIMDENAVIDLLGPTIVNGYYVFEYYILHKRHDCRHGCKRYSLYEKFEKIAKKNAAGDNIFVGVDERHYIVPFKLRD